MFYTKYLSSVSTYLYVLKQLNQGDIMIFDIAFTKKSLNAQVWKFALEKEDFTLNGVIPVTTSERFPLQNEMIPDMIPKRVDYKNNIKPFAQSYLNFEIAYRVCLFCACLLYECLCHVCTPLILVTVEIYSLVSLGVEYNGESKQQIMQANTRRLTNITLNKFPIWGQVLQTIGREIDKYSLGVLHEKCYPATQQFHQHLRFNKAT